MTLDRTGEPIDPDAHPVNCSGWEDPDADGPLRPCRICKPWLAPEELRRALLDADQLRATRPSEGDTA